MISAIGEYVTNKLIQNCITFGFFLAGVLLGIAIAIAIYKIFAHLKAKKAKLVKEYVEIPAKDDTVLQEAISKIHAIDTKISMDSFLLKSMQITANAISDIACEYTGGKKYISLKWTSIDSTTDIDISFDTDFVLEDFLVFIENTTTVVENTVLTVTDKYSILVNSFLKFIGLGKSVRNITVKDVILYLNERATKKEKKLLKAVQKKEKELEKELLAKAKKSENKENKFLAIFKPKTKDKKQASQKQDKKIAKNKSPKKADKEEKENKFVNFFKPKKKENADETPLDNIKISAFYKPINKVIVEILDSLLEGLCFEARKLYGRGYTQSEIEEITQEAEALLCEPQPLEGGNE